MGDGERKRLPGKAYRKPVINRYFVAFFYFFVFAFAPPGFVKISRRASNSGLSCQSLHHLFAHVSSKSCAVCHRHTEPLILKLYTLALCGSQNPGVQSASGNQGEIDTLRAFVEFVNVASSTPYCLPLQRTSS